MVDGQLEAKDAVDTIMHFPQIDDVEEGFDFYKAQMRDYTQIRRLRREERKKREQEPHTGAASAAGASSSAASPPSPPSSSHEARNELTGV